MRNRHLLFAAVAALASGCVRGSVDAGDPVDHALVCAAPTVSPSVAQPSPLTSIVLGDFVPTSTTPGVARTGYVPVLPNPNAPIFATGARRTIYLNRSGATIKAGYDDAAHNSSSVLASTGGQQATVPPATFSEAQWLQLLTCMRDEFARFNMQIVQDRPASGGFIMEMVGGSPGDIGLPQGIGGIAPIDPNGCSVIEGAIVYVFPEGLGNDVQVTCEAGAQEIAHAFSLDHELLASDPMTYLQYSGHKTFQDQDADCGEGGPRGCICQRLQQNSVKVLSEKAGLFQDPNGPMVSITSPDDGATLPGGALAITVHATHAMGVKRVTLRYQDALSFIAADCAGGGLPCARAGDDYTFTVRNAHGLATFFAEAEDSAGIVNATHPRTVSLGPVDNPNNGPITITVAVDLGAFAASRLVKVDATITSSAGAITAATVLWTDKRGAVTANPMCPAGGDAWTRSVQVADTRGERTFVVQAVDAEGHRAASPRYTIVAD